MPIVDMPLEELKKYQGINPCPDDFDAFWDASIAEMKSLDPQVELIPSKFQAPCAECFDLFFTGVRGARIHAKYLRPKNSTEPHPAVIQFHGYTGSSGDWNDKLNYVASGFSVAVLDCRGQGGISEDVGGVKGNTFHGHIIRGLDDSPENMLFRHIFLDTAQLASIVMSFPEVDENRVGAMGGSQGGALTLVCAALEPRIKRLAPIYPFLCDYKRVWEMDLAQNAYAELKDFFRHFDPTHKREEEIFTRLGYIDVQYLAKRIKGQVLMGTGLMDTICPPSTQFAVYNKITAPKDMVIYPDFGHEWLPSFGDMTYEFMMGL
ncbi:acetylesterase [Clostridium thermosuccinogenes]|jgi:cephalosporin-C deacetylase|uniref:Acetylesterase n=1 Tax=Clostridium thermosuccinogenes TaxID=84032 RepID=A0A2K2FEZ6_9CLOT|nr:acetylxylan esterase [Pseudoclostridium thermosuccinogenes]AUS97648.1 acetylesterase [Pseudoclostridium thermosuccinogenes]PNT97362.1 acetylesterase [Pseudoclostridium thermosuccinogenes]PNT99298.1 acetylesterase [Pseudoclostridium thermosuccinogenes]